MRGDAQVDALERLAILARSAEELGGALIEERGKSLALGLGAEIAELAHHPGHRMLRQLGDQRVEMLAQEVECRAAIDLVAERVLEQVARRIAADLAAQHQRQRPLSQLLVAHPDERRDEMLAVAPGLVGEQRLLERTVGLLVSKARRRG